MDETDTGPRPTSCGFCGAAIETDEWHRVTVVDDEDFELLAFCTADCHAAWRYGETTPTH